MSDKDVFKDRERGMEEAYFRRQEQELIEKMRARRAAEAAREEMAAATGIVDDEMLSHLQDMGFNRDTVSLLHVIPLLQVAWADGKVQSGEADQLIRIARLRGIAADSVADQQLAKWIETRPSEEFFTQSLGVVRAMLAAMPDIHGSANRRDLVAFSIAIASASGGILGFGDKVSDEEKSAITEIARALEGRPEAEKVLS
ncbi:MAG: hypothetical protein ACKV2V_22745 [Blastocatellia bacterium]